MYSKQYNAFFFNGKIGRLTPAFHHTRDPETCMVQRTGDAYQRYHNVGVLEKCIQAFGTWREK